MPDKYLGIFLFFKKRYAAIIPQPNSGNLVTTWFSHQSALKYPRLAKQKNVMDKIENKITVLIIEMLLLNIITSGKIM